MVLGWAALPTECGNGGNNLPLTGYGGMGPTVVPVNGNGHREKPAEGQQSLFSWAEFPGLHRGRLWPGNRPVPGTQRQAQALVPVPLRVSAGERAATGSEAGGRGALDRHVEREGHRRICDGLTFHFPGKRR